MGSLKKFDGSSWINSNLRKLTTDTDTFTTFPAIIYAEGTNATVGLKGNTVQSGTPTPDNPVMPEGCGDLETSGEKAGQYKIPISSAGTTTPVYLGEVETTRKIKKLVLTGEEAGITKNTSSETNYLFYIRFLLNNWVYAISAAQAVCTHEPYQAYVQGSVYISNEGAILYLNFGSDIMNAQTSGNTVAGFKEYLAAQYAAGTPVTVWYVLETEETGIVNEPLMKIGDYADTVSGISIPVTAGGDTLSVGTTVQPSEVTANYYGWHTITVHERESGQWD